MSEGCPSINNTIFVPSKWEGPCRKQDRDRISAAARETEDGTTTAAGLAEPVRSPRGVGLLPLRFPASPLGDPLGEAFALAFDLSLGVWGPEDSSTAGAETGP